MQFDDYFEGREAAIEVVRTKEDEFAVLLVDTEDHYIELGRVRMAIADSVVVADEAFYQLNELKGVLKKDGSGTKRRALIQKEAGGLVD